MTAPASPDPVDLAGREVTLLLLERLHAWRARAYERIDLASSGWADRRRIIEAGPLRDVLGDRVAGTDQQARIALPISTVDKGPAIDIAISVAGRPAFQLSRIETARLWVARMRKLAEAAHLPWHPELNDMIAAICCFPLGPWESILRVDLNRGGFDSAVLRYLRRAWAGLGPAAASQPRPTADEFAGWRLALLAVAPLVRSRTLADQTSSAEHPLLALPILPGGPPSSDEVRERLVALSDLLLAADRAADHSPEAEALLREYADCGRHRHLIAPAVVPLDEPFRIEFGWKAALQVEDPVRVLGARWWRRLVDYRTTARQLVVFDDARSSYVNARVDDPSVEITSASELWDELRTTEPDVPQEVRFTDEILTFYESRSGRPPRLWVDLRLKLSDSTQVANYVIWVLALTALAGFLTLTLHVFGAIHGQMINAGDVAVILVPSSVAAALLLVRDSTTLSAEINKSMHIFVAVLLVTLWITTLVFYGFSKIRVGA